MMNTYIPTIISSMSTNMSTATGIIIRRQKLS